MTLGAERVKRRVRHLHLCLFLKRSLLRRSTLSTHRTRALGDGDGERRMIASLLHSLGHRLVPVDRLSRWLPDGRRGAVRKS